MTTQAQTAANRINSQKSTGPRTAEGKAVVSQNAVKHGLLAREAVIRGEDPGEFKGPGPFNSRGPRKLLYHRPLALSVAAREFPPNRT